MVMVSLFGDFYLFPVMILSSLLTLRAQSFFLLFGGYTGVLLVGLHDGLFKVFCKNVVLLELFPIVVALELWGEFFRNRRLLDFPLSHFQ